jgi:hypothetical protein
LPLKFLVKMNFELSGTMVQKGDTQVISERFKKREFVIELKETNNTTNITYSSYAKFQLTQAKCDMIDAHQLGDDLKISFNVRGTKYEKNGQTNYITNLEAWRIEKANGMPASAMPANEANGKTNDDIFIPDAPPSFTADAVGGADDLPF